MTGSAINMSVVEGIIFYYPTKAGCPSKPKIKSKITVLDHDDMSIDGMDQQDDVEEDVKPAMVDVYWQDRLVPETKLTALPFIPDAKTSAQCDKLEIPANWRDRLHGFLFFGWDFKHISNNKLKFQVDPSMDDWLNDKNRFRDEIQSDPKSLKDRFLT